jgi:hypothetical protein
MRHWKWRLMAFLTGFGLGLTLFLSVGFVVSLLRPQNQRTASSESLHQHDCGAADVFSSPAEILAALKSEDVSIRREVFRRLFLRPNVTTIYYDYERDRDYPERADRAELKYLNLDEDINDEALLTFVRDENPVALILKRDECGWHLVAALSAWLRFEDYPYLNWLETPETVKRGVHEILVHESAGDAARYSRNARLLKLLDGALVEVAEFTEESIKPVEDYRAADWNDVRRRETTRCTFIPESNGNVARLRLETQAEIIKYSGAPPTHTFWSETDGAWHTARKQWRERDAERIRLLKSDARELVWDDERKRFVEER